MERQAEREKERRKEKGKGETKRTWRSSKTDRSCPKSVGVFYHRRHRPLPPPPPHSLVRLLSFCLSADLSLSVYSPCHNSLPVHFLLSLFSLWSLLLLPSTPTLSLPLLPPPPPLLTVASREVSVSYFPSLSRLSFPLGFLSLCLCLSLCLSLSSTFPCLSLSFSFHLHPRYLL